MKKPEKAPLICLAHREQEKERCGMNDDDDRLDALEQGIYQAPDLAFVGR